MVTATARAAFVVATLAAMGTTFAATPDPIDGLKVGAGPSTGTDGREDGCILSFDGNVPADSPLEHAVRLDGSVSLLAMRGSTVAVVKAQVFQNGEAQRKGTSLPTGPVSLVMGDGKPADPVAVDFCEGAACAAYGFRDAPYMDGMRKGLHVDGTGEMGGRATVTVSLKEGLGRVKTSLDAAARASKANAEAFRQFEACRDALSASIPAPATSPPVKD